MLILWTTSTIIPEIVRTSRSLSQSRNTPLYTFVYMWPSIIAMLKAAQIMIMFGDKCTGRSSLAMVPLDVRRRYEIIIQMATVVNTTTN
ncbi:hypothetical protein Ddc_10262 [Ditylenchus destructor]|nr:hypothetical protein Ddc_10262 [Ditylenchus destructor]